MDSSIEPVTKTRSMTRNSDRELRIFNQIVYFASGFIAEEVLSILKSSYAESTSYLSDSVTHCIVGKNYIADDVKAAKELYDVTTVTPDWIHMSTLCKKLLPTKPFNPLENNLFSGKIVCVSKVTANDCKTLWALVTYNGGTFSLTLDLNQTTHLVVAKPTGKKYDAVLLNGSDKIKIVTPDWIIDCLENKKLCSETNYHPRLLVSPKLLPTNKSSNVQTKGLSTVTSFAEFDASDEQPIVSATKNQDLEKLKQRLPRNNPSLTSQSKTSSPKVPQITERSKNTKPGQRMSLYNTSKLQQLSKQQVNELQIQQQTFITNYKASSKRRRRPAKPNQDQQEQINQNKVQKVMKGQRSCTLKRLGQQNKKQKQSQQKLQHQNDQLQQDLQSVQQLDSKQQPSQCPQLQQQKVQNQKKNQLPQLQQIVPTQQGQQQQQIKTSQLQQQTVQKDQLQSGQTSQLQKQTIQLQQNLSNPNQVQQKQQTQPQQIQFQIGNSHQVHLSQQQTTQNTQVHIIQQQHEQQSHGTASTQRRTTHSLSNMSNVQVNQQQFQQVHLQTPVIRQQEAVNKNAVQLQTCNIEENVLTLDQSQLESQQYPNESQQMIHMDAKTRNLLQLMTPAERLDLINNSIKQRNLIIQQFKALQQNIASGVLECKNIIRSSIPDDQIYTMMQSLNQPRTPEMIEAQQAQSIQIREQKLLVHQPQQKKQQTANRTTVTSNLETDIKTVCNTLVNSQQVAQPKITSWEQFVITKTEHQEITRSTFATQLDKGNQENQQLQINIVPKQQSSMKHVVPKQPFETEVMRINVVQPPQVSNAQTSIVQSQQKPISLTNKHTKTQLPSQKSFAQTSVQEVSDAKQSRLKTTQDHAAQQQSTTHQSETASNNVINFPSLLLPANKDQSTVVKVAEILEKSAALQPISYQTLPNRHAYLGHKPDIDLPSHLFLLGCVFLIVEYDHCPNTRNDLVTWKKIIMDHGGEIDVFYTQRLTHILCKTQMHPCVQQGLYDGKRCITAYWLSDVIIKQQLLPPWLALHFPTLYSKEKPCRQMILSLTNFEGEERNRVKFMIELTGAKVTSYFSADNDILVSRKLEGKKVKRAQDINRPIVNVQWLNAILFGHFSCLHEPEKSVYQQFNLNNPFKVDYNLVYDLMKAWKVPINIDPEVYDAARNIPIPIKRKRTKSNVSDLIDQENSGLNTADIIITNVNPPPIKHRPCVMLSGFGLGKEEQRMVLQLGGTIAEIYSDATHLVMKEPVRTTKFLCCISTVKHIVTAEWLKDSFAQHMFLSEANYTVEELTVDEQVTCEVPKVLSNPNRHELFKGKIFYITPGVTRPSKSVVRQIIESAGGTVEKQRRSLKSIHEFEPNTYIVIATNNDLHLVADLIHSPYYNIYSSEFILSAVMTQCINYDTVHFEEQKHESSNF